MGVDLGRLLHTFMQAFGGKPRMLYFRHKGLECRQTGDPCSQGGAHLVEPIDRLISK